MKTMIFLIILGLHPVTGAPNSVAQGPFASNEECQAAWKDFTLKAHEAGLPGNLFNATCLQWTYSKDPNKKETTL